MLAQGACACATGNAKCLGAVALQTAAAGIANPAELEFQVIVRHCAAPSPMNDTDVAIAAETSRWSRDRRLISGRQSPTVTPLSYTWSRAKP